MNHDPSNHPTLAHTPRTERVSRRVQWLTQGAGTLLVLLGLTTMVGWLARLPGLLQPLPDAAGMVFSTALCFALAGIALLLPGHRPNLRQHGQPLIGGLLVLIASAVLVQHLAKIDIGIDLPSIHAWFSGQSPAPGRMSPNTALAFFLCGAALLLIPLASRHSAWRAIEILGFLVLFIGLTGVVGYALRLEFLYTWYQYTRMAPSTAAGMMVLGIGLWGVWHRLPAAAPLVKLQTQNRIILIGGSIFFTIALVAGLSGFAVMQQHTETTLQNGLLHSLHGRTDFFNSIVGEASNNAQLIATRPAIYRHVAKLNAEPGNAAELALLTQAAKSFLPLGFSVVVFYDKSGRELVRAGSLAKDPKQSVALSLPFPAQLTWYDGFMLEARLPMRENGQTQGSVMVQRPLEVLSRMLQDTRSLGETGETAVCAPEGQRIMRCFPLRLNPKPLRIPYEANGRPLPMSHALEGRSGVVTAFDYRRQNVTAAYGPIGSLGLGMVIKTDTAELYQPIGEYLKRAVVLLLGFILTGMWILYRLVAPLVQRVVESEEKYRAVSESANEAIVTADAGGRIVFWNRAAETTFGYSEREILGEQTSVLIQKDYRAAHEEGWARLVSTQQPGLLGKTVELRGQHKDGRRFPLEMSLSAWHGGDGERYFTGLMRDISRRKQAEQAALHLADIVESSSDAIISKNQDGIVTSWNAAAERLYGYSAREIIGQPGHVLLPADNHTEEQEYLNRLRGGEHFVRLDTIRLKKDGTPLEVAVTVSPLRDASGEIVGTSTISRDITERKRTEALTRALAVTDELTGLHNRRGFTTIAEQQIKIARRNRVPLHIGFIDLDGMKAINDRFGHAVGDEALKDTATVLRGCFRDSDVLARIGGDEFVVLTIGADDKAMLLLQERLFAALARTNREAQRPYALSFSLGVVACDVEAGQTLEQMLEEADRRMYQAKGDKRRADRGKP